VKLRIYMAAIRAGAEGLIEATRRVVFVTD